ncbi:hypothetical protein F5Y08DRAFT_48461 [Xylaria arbuscula]|nr:hypothetical protein F5Y08DRAFT_48461 [Xylaria arbuscula]
MESTFVDALGISLNIETAYDMILAVGSSPTATVQQAKEALRRLNSLLPNAERQPDPKRILRSLIFPVRYPNGSVELSCAHQVDFGIVDQEIFEQDLRDSEEILDFTLAEVHDLHPLIKWAGLEGRFLSARTVEMTKPLGATEIMPSSQRDIRLKAHLLCRIAAHFNSRRASDIELLHHVLGQSQLFVYRSSHIITELCLVENGCLVAVDQQESGVLLDDTNGMLNIYLPRDTHRQGECFVFDLPHALYRWIMAESPMGEENPEAEFAKRLITVVLNLEPHMATLFLNKEGIAALNSLTADNISDVQKPLPQVRVRLPPVQAPEGVTNSVDKPKITENENDKRKVESIQDKPMAMFTGNGIVKAEESSPLSVFENLRITSPLPSSGQQLSCG